jgi:hypothetical protein
MSTNALLCIPSILNPLITYSSPKPEITYISDISLESHLLLQDILDYTMEALHRSKVQSNRLRGLREKGKLTGFKSQTPTSAALTRNLLIYRFQTAFSILGGSIQHLEAAILIGNSCALAVVSEFEIFPGSPSASHKYMLLVLGGVGKFLSLTSKF